MDDNNAVDYSNVLALTIDGIGIGYNFFPNPTENGVYYQTEIDRVEQLDIEVTDVLGRRLKQIKRITQVGRNDIFIDLSSYSSGAYLIKVLHKSSGALHQSKIIKKD